MKFKISKILALCISISACGNQDENPISYDGITLNDSYKKLTSKYSNLNCIKTKTEFTCINNDTNGAAKFTMNSDEKINSIRAYWTSNDINPQQILSIYKQKYGDPTEIRTFSQSFSPPEYFWCKEKSCEIYRVITFSSPIDNKCLGDFSSDFEINDLCNGKQFVMSLSISNIKDRSSWFDKNNKEVINLK